MQSSTQSYDYNSPSFRFSRMGDDDQYCLLLGIDAAMIGNKAYNLAYDEMGLCVRDYPVFCCSKETRKERGYVDCCKKNAVLEVLDERTGTELFDTGLHCLLKHANKKIDFEDLLQTGRGIFLDAMLECHSE